MKRELGVDLHVVLLVVPLILRLKILIIKLKFGCKEFLFKHVATRWLLFIRLLYFIKVWQQFPFYLQFYLNTFQSNNKKKHQLWWWRLYIGLSFKMYLLSLKTTLMSSCLKSNNVTRYINLLFGKQFKEFKCRESAL